MGGSNLYWCLFSVLNGLLSNWPFGKILTGPVHFSVTLDTLSGYPEPWFSKREQDTAELGANTDANHNFTKFFQTYIFLFDANERICFGFQEFPPFT